MDLLAHALGQLLHVVEGLASMLGDLGHNWSEWATYGSTDRMLWGHTVEWWGRFGKILELLAGLAVLAEIVGADRLSQFAEALLRKTQQVVSRGFLTRLIVRPAWFGLRLLASVSGLLTVLVLCRWAWRFRLPRSRTMRRPTWPKLQFQDWRAVGSASAAMVFSPWFVVAFWSTTALSGMLPGSDSSDAVTPAIIFGAVIFVLLLVAYLAVLVGLLILLLTPLLLVAYHAIIRPFVWALEQPHLEQHVKVVSVVLLVIGFHFDLLST